MLLGVVLFSLLHCIPLYVCSGITVLGFHGLTLGVGVSMSSLCLQISASRFSQGVSVAFSLLWLLILHV